MATIEVDGLAKVYQVYRKREGVLASIGGLFRRTYHAVHAVRDVSFQIDSGEFVAFLGPNGAGKTTTLKLLSGLIYPTSGEARVLGHIPWKRENAYRRRFALVMGQKNQLWWDLPAQESFRLHKEIYGIDSGTFRRRLDELTDLLEVGELMGQPVRELSLGERMRMELIAAFLHGPEVLFLDEPTIGLDVVAQRTIQQFLKNYQAKYGITVVLTSHYMKDVAALCPRVIVITHGRILHDGSLAGILDRFSRFKRVSLLFAGDSVPEDLSRYGDVEDIEPPRAVLQVERTKVAGVLSSLLERYALEDVSVEDRPLDDVIAEVFRSEATLNQDTSKVGAARIPE